MAPKVLLTRPLPAAGQTSLQKAHDQGRIDLIKRDDDSTAPREWLLTQLRTNDVEGILCMLGDKVSCLGYTGQEQVIGRLALVHLPI